MNARRIVCIYSAGYNPDMNARNQQAASGRSRQGFGENSGGIAWQRRQAVEAGTLRRASLQMSLFGSLSRSGSSSPFSASPGGPVGRNDSRPMVEPHPGAHGRSAARGAEDNPHLAKAKRIARQMRRMPDYSPEETRAGLAICRQLKAYLSD